MRRAAAAGAVVVPAGLAATPAHAHLVETGFGSFYDGLAHVALTPADLLVVVALALLAGQRGSRAARWALFALPVAWLGGGAAGAHWGSGGALPLLTTLSFAVVGALVALNVSMRDVGVAALAVAAGLLHGIVNGATMAPAGASALALVGATDRDLLPDRGSLGRGDRAAGRMAAHRRAGGGQLDRRRGPVDAGLVDARGGVSRRRSRLRHRHANCVPWRSAEEWPSAAMDQMRSRMAPRLRQARAPTVPCPFRRPAFASART